MQPYISGALAIARGSAALALAVPLFSTACSSVADAPHTDYVGPAGSVPAPEALRELASQPPPGVEAGLWARLTDALEYSLRSASGKQALDGPPLSAQSAVSDFYVYPTGPDSGSFRWTYRNQGDYDQNGLVTIADLTPVGVHFGKRSTSPDWIAAQLADGDRNGEVNISDVTPIGQNFGNRVDGWYVEESVDLVFPNWQPFGSISGFSGTEPAQGGFLEMGTAFGGLTSGRYYRVVPFSGDTHDGTDVGGIPGNPAGFNLSQAGSWPVAECDASNSGQAATGGPLSPLMLWSAPVMGEVSGPPVSSFDSIYVNSSAEFEGGHVYAWETISGEQKWHYRGAVPFTGSPAVAFDGSVYTFDAFGTLYCFAPDGALKFTRQPLSSQHGSPNLDAQGNIYAVGASGAASSAVRLDRNGTLLMEHPLSGSLSFCTPLVTPGEGMVLCQDNGIVSSISAAGALLDSGNLLHPASGSVVSDNFGGVYVNANIPQGGGSPVGTLYRLDGNLEIDWIYGGDGFVTGSPSRLPDNSVVFCTADILDENPAGSVIWLSPAGSLVDSRQPGGAVGKPAVDISGNVYVAVDAAPGTSGLYCYDSSRNLLWFHASGDLAPTSPAIVAPNIVAFGTREVIGDAAESEVQVLGTPVL